MKQFIVSKSKFSGTLSVPASKSHTMRSLIFGSMANGVSYVHNILESKHTTEMIAACRLLGAKIEVDQNELRIYGMHSKPSLPKNVIDARNSGQILYYVGALTSLINGGLSVITGDESIRENRPVIHLLDGINQLGGYAKSTRNNGYAPMVIGGVVNAGNVTINGEASLPVSAMLIISSFLAGTTNISIRNPGEKPWVGLTLSWLERGGIKYKNNDYQEIIVYGTGEYNCFDYRIPSDFSSAAYPIVAALISKSEITLKDIDMGDSQGDKELIFVLQKMGANIEYDAHQKILHIKKTNELQGIEVDINDFIDSVTILAVVGCFASGKTIIKSAKTSRFKECDRIACITKELKKLGADIEEFDDGLIISQSKLTGAHVASHNDHRMALSLAVAGVGAEGETVVSNVDCTEKSFPDFVDTVQKLGANIRYKSFE